MNVSVLTTCSSGTNMNPSVQMIGVVNNETHQVRPVTRDYTLHDSE